jgi:GTP diphosphokinase / guanosine-3',5'-bis(diphosphate) 3'-diphosphatase
MNAELLKIDSEDLNLTTERLWAILRPKLDYLSQADLEIVELAFWQMKEAHQQQRRKSGEFYITHPVAATLTLAGIGLDRDTLAACLMHDVPEDTEVTLKTIQKNFSSQIAFLVGGITKLSKVKYQGEQRYVENLRRMFVAMSQDLRVIFIKLADRLHNLQTLEHVRPDKAKRIALESLEIYSPIAERLGIGFFKGAIEDAAFPYVYPEIYEQFVSDSTLEIERRKKLNEDLIQEIKQKLEEHKIPFKKIYGRAKKYYSIYRKTMDRNIGLQEQYDLVAIRVLTDNLEECYTVLSSLHEILDIIQPRTKDYIANPKPNGYQSIHVNFTHRQTKQIFEIQIRTQEMHDFAEYGVAAHYAYKAQNKGHKSFEFVSGENLKWIEQLVELGNKELSEEEYLQRVKLDLFQDRIFVMTPKGDVIDLPIGSTPLDFAFKIHEQIGAHASLAKVNGNPVKLSDELHNGDVVEILTDKKQSPKKDWLNLVKSVYASKRIRALLRKKQG